MRTEMTGDNVRRVLRLMDPDDRRVVLMSLYNQVVRREAPADPLGRLLEALYHDIYAAEDEDRALVVEIEG